MPATTIERLAGAILAGALTLLTGCAGFFPPLTTTTSSTSTSGDFVYVANATTDTIAGFTVATTTAGVGTLTAISGSPYSFPVSPTAMAITPANTFLYVAGIGGIYAYAINATTGVLTAVSSGGAVAITTLASVSVDISPDGKWLFALSQDNATLSEYQINTTTGALTVQTPTIYTSSNFATVSAKMVRVAPNGAFVVVALGTGGDLVFPFTTGTGVLSSSYQQLATGASTTSDNALAVDGTSSYLYIARSGTTTGVAVYAIGSGGALGSVSGSPFTAGNGPFSVLLDSTGKYVYAGNRTDGTVSGFTIGTGGVLTAIAGSPFAGGALVDALARDNSAKYILAAAAGGSPDLTLYSFDATTAGKLDSAATTTTGTDPTGAIIVVTTH